MLARWHASATVAGSKIRRISKRSLARSLARRPVRLLKSMPAAGSSSATKVPLPRRISSTPWATRKEIASRRVVRLTSKALLNSFSLGSLLPGAYRASSTIISYMRSDVCSDSFARFLSAMPYSPSSLQSFNNITNLSEKSNGPIDSI